MSELIGWVGMCMDGNFLPGLRLHIITQRKMAAVQSEEVATRHPSLVM